MTLAGLVANPAFRRAAARFRPTRPVARAQAARLFDLCAGFAYAQTLLAFVRLGLPERLHAAAATPEALAAELDLPEAGARVLLRASASLGLAARRRDGRYRLGMLGAALVGAPGVVAMIEHNALLYADLVDPVAVLRQGGAGAIARYWPYASGGGAAQAAGYSALMAASQAMLADEVLDAVRLAGRFRCLLDVGGGDGAFLRAAARRVPGLRLMLADRPEVAAIARARLDASGVRAEVHGGDFLHEALPVGADLVCLVRVLHDQDDAGALRLLRQVHAALPPGGTVMIAEPMSGTRGGGGAADAYFGLYLRAMGSGRPRRPDELRALLVRAGFGRGRMPPVATPLLARVLLARRR